MESRTHYRARVSLQLKWGPYVKDRVSDGMVNQGGTTRLRPLAEFSVKGLFIFGAASIRHE